MERSLLDERLQTNEDEGSNFFTPLQTFSKTINVASDSNSILNSIQPWNKQSKIKITQQGYKSFYTTRVNATARESFRKKILISRKNSLNQQFGNQNSQNQQKLQAKADILKISFRKSISGKNNKYKEELSNLMSTLQIQQNDMKYFKRIGKNNPQTQKFNQTSTKIVNFQQKISSSLYCYPQSPSKYRQDFKKFTNSFYSQTSKGSNNLQKILKIKQKIRKKNYSKMKETKRFSKSQTLTLVTPQPSQISFLRQSTELEQKYIFSKSSRKNEKKATLKINEANLNQINQVQKRQKYFFLQKNQKQYQLRGNNQKNQITIFNSKKLRNLQFWKAKASKYLN